MIDFHHFTEFAGLPVQDFNDEKAGDLPAADAVAWRLSTGYHGSGWSDVFADFLEEVGTTRVTSLVIGFWPGDGGYPPHLLAQAADRFPALRDVFVGDITAGENEISWIVHKDLNPMLAAFPLLERVGTRGSVDLEPFRSEALRELRMESGGLHTTTVQAVAASDLPNLEHLELWLGDEWYGGTSTMADVAPILTGERLPALRRLGLCNSEYQDEIAEAVAGSPLVARLTDLDLSKGALTDRGVEALLAGQPLTHLRSLDLDHNFVTEPLRERLVAALPGVRVSAEPARLFDPAEPGRTYVAVSE